MVSKQENLWGSGVGFSLLLAFLVVLPCFGESVSFSEYCEVEITLSESLSLSDIEGLSIAPGSEVEVIDGGQRVVVQLAKDDVEELISSGAEVSVVRSFRFVSLVPAEGRGGTAPGDASAMACSGDYYEGTSSYNVYILDDEHWWGSGLDFGLFPSETVTCIDVNYAIVNLNWLSLVDVGLSDTDPSYMYELENSWWGSDGDIFQTRTGITAFAGEALNQEWWLWAGDFYADGFGYIDSWWIKLYYDTGPPTYCTATSSSCGWEHIDGVEVGDIDNLIDECSFYADYTAQSTSMQRGSGYPITVTNGLPWDSGDDCGLWVDWNQDHVFDVEDEDEVISLSYGQMAGDGAITFVGTITPPTDAVLGDTRMRVRMLYYDFSHPLSPCGVTPYGEVEDYTITVTEAVQDGIISGRKFNDLNYNGIEDGGEPGLSGWVIYLDLNDNGQLDGGEPNDTTDASGDYVIYAPEPGTYTVAEVGQNGWRQTAPVHLPESISVSDAQDLVFDWKRDLLYISRENGTVMRYDLSAHGLLSAYTVGTELNRMDITVDGDTLYVSEEQADGVAELGYLHKVRLSDGAVTDISYELDFGEWGSWDVSIGCCGKGLMTTKFEGSGRVPLRELQVSTDTLAIRTDLPGYHDDNVNQNTRIFRSADRTFFFLAEGNSSAGPLFTYDAVTDTFGAFDEISTYVGHIPIAVNRDGSLIALKTHSGPIRILNRSLSRVKLLNTDDGGLVFDTVRDILYVVDSDSDEIVALETRCWNELFRIDVGQDISDYDIWFNRGYMAVSDDGRFLALSTSSAVLVFRIDMKHEVTVGAGETIGDIDFGNLVTYVGDFDGDSDVDWVDVDVLCEAWLTDEACVDIWPAGGDGIANIHDFATMAKNWLAGTGP